MASVVGTEKRGPTRPGLPYEFSLQDLIKNKVPIFVKIVLTLDLVLIRLMGQRSIIHKLHLHDVKEYLTLV